MSDPIVLNAIGDVVVDRDDPSTAFRYVQEQLAAGDIRFGNCEAAYSDTSDRFPRASAEFVAAPACFDAIRQADFTVMNLANNHSLDGGYSGLDDTRDLLHRANIQTVGAGQNLEEARRPAVVESKGMKVGFLGYTCVFPPGSDAAPSHRGLATLNVHTAYKAEVGQPGTRPIVLTLMEPTDKASVVDDVERLRVQADAVVVSFHWGLHLLPAEIADYERELGHAVIDAGADVVLGHHQHIIKAVEVYRGKPLFHGLGNFIFDVIRLGEFSSSGQGHTFGRSFGEFYGEYRAKIRPDTPNLPLHPESRRTMIARIQFEKGADPKASIVPCLIDLDATPVPLAAGSQEFQEYVDYLADITRRVGLATTYKVEGDTIAVVA